MTLDGRGDDRRTTVERVDPAASRVSLYWRVFAVNAAILSVAVLLLIVTPVSIDPQPTRGQLVVLVGGLLVMLVANAWLVRFSLRPLRRLSELMSIVDILEPGRRLDPAATAEVAAVISTFNSTLDRLEGERRQSMNRVLAAQEAERRRIAQELHDQIGQNLTAVVLELKRVRERIDPSEAEALADAQELARESLEEVRRISYELRPAALDDLGLASALASLCSGIERRAGIVVQLAVAGDVPALDGAGRAGGLPRRAGGADQRGAARAVQDRASLARPRCRRRPPARVGRRDRHERQLPGRRDARHARARGRCRRHPRDPTGGRRRDRGFDAYPRCGGRRMTVTARRTIRILLADDHAVVRRGLRMVLETEPDMEVVCEADDGLEAVELAIREEVDLAVLDVTMPRMSGLQAAHELSRRVPSLRILMLSMHHNEQYFLEALRAGAGGYVLKSVADHDLIRACRAVMRGEPFMYPDSERRMLGSALELAGDAGIAQLTRRESEILALIAEGHTTREIAEMLVISPRTVDRHRDNLLDKLNLRNRIELTRYAIRAGLIEP